MWLLHPSPSYLEWMEDILESLHIPADVSRFSNPMIHHFQGRKRTMPDFSDAELQRLKMPVLLAVSPKDAIFNANAITARLKSLLLGSLKVVILPHGGYSLYGLKDIIIPFLSSSNRVK